MSDRKDIDFDTLPSSSDELIDDDLDSIEDDNYEEDMSFDDEEELLDSIDGEDEEGSDDDGDDDDDDNDNDDDDDDDLVARSKVKDIAIYGGGGVVVIGAAAFYLQSVLGINLFGGSEDPQPANPQSSSEISQRSNQLRDMPTGDLLAERDSTIFDVDSGWGDEGLEVEYADNTVFEDNTGEVSTSALDTERGEVEREAVREESSSDFRLSTSDLVRTIRGELEEVVEGAVSGLLTREYFDESIDSLESGVVQSLGSQIASSEEKVSEFIKDAISQTHHSAEDNNVNRVSPKVVDSMEGRSRINGVNVIDASANGEMSVIKNTSGVNNVLSVGESINVEGARHVVTDIIDNGNVVLVGDSHYIDGKRVQSSRYRNESEKQQPQRPSRSNSEQVDRSKAVERFKAEKSVADSLIRSYERYKIKYSDMQGDSMHSIRKSSNQEERDFVISHRNPSVEQQASELQQIGSGFIETPRQTSLIIAEGWKGSMIMGDEFLVIDPSGNWRKLKKGERVVELGNNLVHGLDGKNNLIIGNRVVLFE